jgi:DNA polymerase-3 subunit beta
MTIEVPRKTLGEVLAHLERVVPSRSGNPSLSLLRLELSGGHLKLSGSSLDLDLQATLAVNSSVDHGGPWALPAHVFGQVARALPGELVELTFENAELEVRSGSYATKLQLMTTDLPELTFPSNLAGRFPAERLGAALRHVRYAAAVAEYQAIFRGVKLELQDRRTRAVATDGFRLAYYHLDEPTGLAGDIVVPARSADELVKLLGDGEVRLGLGEGQLSLETGPYRLNVKLMEGVFPDYERVIPSQFPVSITLPARALLEGVQRVAVMADRKAKNRVDLFVKDGTLQITAEGAYGRAQEAVAALQEGKESEIALAYNADYLLSALRPVEGDVRFSFSGSTRPSVLSSLADPSYLAMVVPLMTG